MNNIMLFMNITHVTIIKLYSIKYSFYIYIQLNFEMYFQI